MRRRTLLIDADILVYAAAAASETAIQWDADLFTLHASKQGAIAHLDRAVCAVQQQYYAQDFVLALSDYSAVPWRRRLVMPEYKAARRTTRKPMVYRALREHARETYPTLTYPGLEGDDVLSLLLTGPTPHAVEYVAVSDDKDLRTVPGKHGPLRGPAVERAVSCAEADHAHMVQALAGDTTDGYFGCPRIGLKTAERILAPFVWMDGSFDTPGAWAATVAAYEKAGLTADDALRNARVARLLRHGEYDADTGAVTLWEPPT